MKKLLIVLALFLSACSQTPKVPFGATFAALHYWPAAQYPADKIRLGPTSHQSPYSATSGLYDAWCVEVIVNQNGQDVHASVKVVQTSPTDSAESWLAISDPVMNSDCSSIK